MRLRTDVQILLLLAAIAASFLVGTMWKSRGSGDGHGAESGEIASPHSEIATLWTCSMHPQIKLPSPGKCPICFMDLIPLESDVGSDDSEVRLSMSEASSRLAEISTTPVVRAYPNMEVRLVGKVEYDETRQRKIAAWVGGRLDRLYVDYTGVRIRHGDHLVSMYSPALVSAQEELLQALALNSGIGDSQSELLRSTAARTVEASREKLRLLGLTDEQIGALEQRGIVDDHVTIYAPIDGVVIAKNAVEGSYVQTGTTIYEIADLSHLWVKMDAYESDLQWLRYGQEVRFATEAYPGRDWTGRISFIDPVLDARTRTAKVRVNIDNAAGLLKPGMFVRAVVLPKIATAGRVMDVELAGKWICPMHPEMISERPGKCPTCEMALVKTSELGYSVASPDEEPPLVIPATAPLVTGRRAVVYVRVPDAERPTFEGREVVLGPRAGDQYTVLSGLSEGEDVVVHGAFKIDSAMQIQAKPSMMNPEGGVASATAHQHVAELRLSSPPEFRQQLWTIADSYLDMAAALAADDFARASAGAAALAERLAKVDMGALAQDAHMKWMGLLRDLEPAARSAAAAPEIQTLRGALPALTAGLGAALEMFNGDDERDIYLLHCPMAFDGDGAEWLQASPTTANPYYGSSMLRCGDVSRQLVGSGE